MSKFLNRIWFLGIKCQFEAEVFADLHFFTLKLPQLRTNEGFAYFILCTVTNRSESCYSWSIVYGPAEPAKSEGSSAATREIRQANEATLTNLRLCTNYQIDVAAVSSTGELGPPATDFAQTVDARESF